MSSGQARYLFTTNLTVEVIVFRMLIFAIIFILVLLGLP